MIRAAGFSPATAAVAVLGGPPLYAGTVLGSRILSAAILAVLAGIEQSDRPLAEAEELLVWLPRVVQAVVTLMSIAAVDEVIRSVGGIVATLLYAGCGLLGWAVRKAATAAIAAFTARRHGDDERLAMTGREVSEARIQEWNAAWTRALEHLERERRAGPPAG